MEIKLFYITLGMVFLHYIAKWGMLKYPKGLWHNVFKELKEWANAGLWAVIIALFVMSFIVQAFKIPSGSMRDTLQIGDHLFVNKFIYGIRILWNKENRIFQFKSPNRKDIIVFEYPPEPSKDYIKRCIGLPGDTVKIEDKKVYVNGNLLKEPYVTHKDPNIYSNAGYIPENLRPRDNYGPVDIPDGKYFVLGDNRDFSADSRYWGLLPGEYIKGRALFKYWPPSRIGLIE